MLPNQLNQQNNLGPPSSLQSALQMDPNPHIQQQLQQQAQQQQQSQAPTTQSAAKRRRKADANGDDAPAASEPRRLRRSHEACARCRSKKIKCDSKHPRCTACATAGTVCHQEDRHRQTLTPRGHTEHVEHQLAQCDALLKRHIPGFSLENLDEILVREGIDLGSIAPPTLTAIYGNSDNAIRPISFRPDAGSSGPTQQSQPPKGYPPMYQHMMHPGYPPHMMPYGAPSPYHLPLPPPGYNPQIHPAFQQPPPNAPYPPLPQPPPPQAVPQPQLQAPNQQQSQTPQQQSQPKTNSTKGTDPNGNDLSNTEALARSFGVSASIVNEMSLGPGPIDKEDLAVGSNGLTSGRDRTVSEATVPRNVSTWVSIPVRRNSSASSTTPNTLSLPGPTSTAPIVQVWLPKDRKMVQHIVEVYFTRLNFHRPVFARKDFEKIINDLYDSRTISHDPGYVCSIYLILALGTLSELNHRAVKADVDNKAEVVHHLGSAMAKKLMPYDWPEHDEFFELALGVKPDLRVTISSLQALILLHWYLYTERQGRTLWRLVGSLVRLSIELGLHHDPTTQYHPLPPPQDGNPPPAPQCLFSEEECQLRIRLWGIVLVHDRGTSILLGRPLAIAPSDSNTPRPIRPMKHSHLDDFSEHFELSHPVTEIQADIINSLYAPKKQPTDIMMRNATRIIKSMLEFRRSMPERYKPYFSGTNDWPLEKRSKLVQEITEDEGLTLLKIGICRILLLRALFSTKDLYYPHRGKALDDAIITSHNIIIVHNQLIRFPDTAFFTSPIPLHISAMVILYGQMSKREVLSHSTAVEDICLALDMLPRFRWRWERKDVNGGHPLISKLAERVLNVDLHSVVPSSPQILLCEIDWSEDSPNKSPQTKSQLSTPTLTHNSSNVTHASSHPVYGPQPRNVNGGGAVHTNNGGSSSGGSTPPGNLADVPAQLFYPFYPENQVAIPPNTNGGTGGAGISTSGNGAQHQDYNHILAAAATQDGAYGCQPSHDSFMSEELDPRHTAPHHGMQMYMNVQGQRSAMRYPAQSS